MYLLELLNYSDTHVITLTLSITGVKMLTVKQHNHLPKITLTGVISLTDHTRFYTVISIIINIKISINIMNDNLLSDYSDTHAKTLTLLSKMCEGCCRIGT